MDDKSVVNWSGGNGTMTTPVASPRTIAKDACKNGSPPSFDGAFLLSEVLKLWPEPNEAFIRGLVPLLLGREADAAGMAYGLSLLRRGSRLQTVRTIAECAEAQLRQLDTSWVPELERLRRDGSWVKVRLGLRRGLRALWQWIGNPFRRRTSELMEQYRRAAERLHRLEELVVRIAAFTTEEQRHKQQARWLQAGDLRAYERKVFSQNGEDGIIQEILYRIGAGPRYFVEFGVESGIECNCARLAMEEGWSGLFLEASDADFGRLEERYRDYPGVRCAKAIVTSQNIEALLAENGVPADLDLLSIDIDGNDYWVWKAIVRWRPRLVVMEYNATYPPSKKWVMRENPDHRWGRTSYFGASLASLGALAREKGYTLVGTNSRGVNAFFVRDDLVMPERFLDPCVHYHFTAPDVGPFLGGNPPGSGPGLEI